LCISFVYILNCGLAALRRPRSRFYVWASLAGAGLLPNKEVADAAPKSDSVSQCPEKPAKTSRTAGVTVKAATAIGGLRSREGRVYVAETGQGRPARR
jgi:hypothetical protein